MRVLQIVHVVRDPDGGSAGVTMELAKEWRSDGHQVVDLYADDLIRIASPRLRDRILPLIATHVGLSRAAHFDVFDVAGHLGWLLFPLLRRRPRRPLLIARSFGLEHDDYRAHLAEARAGHARLSLASRLGSAALRLREVEATIRASDGFSCPLNVTAEHVAHKNWKERDQVFSRGYGLTSDAAQVKRDAERQWGGRLVWCGTTVERKGWRYFVEAFSQLARRSEIFVDVLGSCLPKHDVLLQFPADIRWRVTVHPRLSRESQFRCMAAGDVFVSASLFEGFHRALLEAMGIGLPCIATPEGFLKDVASVTELVEPIQPMDSAAIVRAIETLRAQARRRAALAKRGARFARSYQWISIAREEMEWFGMLTQKRTSQRQTSADRGGIYSPLSRDI